MFENLDFINNSVEYITVNSRSPYREVNGKLEVKESLTMKTSSQLEGEAVIGKLIVESGAIFNAKCSMRSSSDVKSINKGIEKTA